MPNDYDYSTLIDRLNTAHSWPCEYTFKFIIPHQESAQVHNLFEPETSLRKVASRTGKYISVTAEIFMASADQVIAIYKKAASIQGIIML